MVRVSPLPAAGIQLRQKGHSMIIFATSEDFLKPAGWIRFSNQILSPRTDTCQRQPAGFSKMIPSRPRKWPSDFKNMDFNHGIGAGQMADHRLLLIISMPCGEHGGESGDLFLAPPTFARLFKLAPVPDDFERAFAIDFFLKSPQGTVHWFAFFKFNLCQFTHFLSRDGWCCVADPAGCSIAAHYVLLHFEVKPFETL